MFLRAIISKLSDRYCVRQINNQSKCAITSTGLEKKNDKTKNFSKKHLTATLRCDNLNKLSQESTNKRTLKTEQ